MENKDSVSSSVIDDPQFIETLLESSQLVPAFKFAFETSKEKETLIVYFSLTSTINLTQKIMGKIATKTKRNNHSKTKPIRGYM